MNYLAQNPFGTVPPPEGVKNIGGGQVAGIGILVNIILKTLIVVAMVYAVINLVLAGYAYMSGAGDSKQISAASAKIWQTIIGILVAAGSVMLAGLIGQILFKDPNAILQIKIFTP
jgi:hypothetical protein